MDSFSNVTVRKTRCDLWVGCPFHLDCISWDEVCPPASCLNSASDHTTTLSQLAVFTWIFCPYIYIYVGPSQSTFRIFLRLSSAILCTECSVTCRLKSPKSRLVLLTVIGNRCLTLSLSWVWDYHKLILLYFVYRDPYTESQIASA